jgi:hypothetical protein
MSVDRGVEAANLGGAIASLVPEAWLSLPASVQLRLMPLGFCLLSCHQSKLLLLQSLGVRSDSEASCTENNENQGRYQPNGESFPKPDLHFQLVNPLTEIGRHGVPSLFICPK